MIIYIVIIVLACLYYKISNYRKYSKPAHLSHLKTVPVVSGGLPFVGHGLKFSKDIIGFVEACSQKYGKIFRVQIFRTDMVIICDREMLNEFFRAKENNLSLNTTLNRLFFGDAFTADEAFLPTIIDIVKTTIKVKYDDFIPKIQLEAQRMMEVMKSNAGKKISLTGIMMKFIACTSARCFVDMELTDVFYDALVSFSYILNKTVILTYFFPKWFLRLTAKPFLTFYRNKMISMLKPIINEYRINPDKTDSPILRKAVDYVDEKSGKSLTDEQVGGIIVCLLYVSTENTALGLSATVTDLAINHEYWNKVRRDCHKYIKNNDYVGLFRDAKVIHACFLESARMNTHVFPLNRYPIEQDCSVGGYHVGKAVSVGVCAPMMMCKENFANDTYENPTKYDPERFLTKKESISPTNLMTFGANTHLCPGKMFALMEIKTAVALVTSIFKPFSIQNLGKLDYFGPSAFAERQVETTLELRDSDDILKDEDEISSQITNYNNKGWLIRDFLTRDEQIECYNYTINLSENSVEHAEAVNASDKHSYAITYYNLVYTGTRNCSNPYKLFDLGNKAIRLLKEKVGFVGKSNFTPNSIHAQLFNEKAKLAIHKDEYCDWGVSVSLGASCEFSFDNEIITLNSGDVFVADFSKVDHGVNKISDEPPGWFHDDSGCGVKTFGFSRMSIQIRDIDPQHFKRDNMMTIDEFKKMVTSY